MTEYKPTLCRSREIDYINEMPIEGFSSYLITNDGRIWSKKKKGRWLIPYKNTYGYYTVGLYENKKRTMCLLHRLIAQTFIPNLDNKPEINHKNGVKTDNRIQNLEWCTRSENALHSFKIGLQNNKGENAPSSKLVWKQIDEIRNNHISEAIMTKKPWLNYGISMSQYYNIINNKMWIKNTEAL